MVASDPRILPDALLSKASKSPLQRTRMREDSLNQSQLKYLPGRHDMPFSLLDTSLVTTYTIGYF